MYDIMVNPSLYIYAPPLATTVYLGLSPGPVTVTTRIFIFLVGDPELSLHLPLLLGRGDNPKYIIQY